MTFIQIFNLILFSINGVSFVSLLQSLSGPYLTSKQRFVAHIGLFFAILGMLLSGSIMTGLVK